ncbi:MAG: hypothetical protein AAF654_07910 [Myxococcota bacterium]
MKFFAQLPDALQWVEDETGFRSSFDVAAHMSQLEREAGSL